MRAAAEMHSARRTQFFHSARRDFFDWCDSMMPPCASEEAENHRKRREA